MDLFGGLRDFSLTEDGDLIIEQGDIKYSNGIEWFTQEVIKILKSSNDWYFAPDAGATLDRFHGQNNTRDTASIIKDVITSKIKRQGIHIPADLEVRVVPISLEEIKVYIMLKFNKETINITNVVFNLQDGMLKNVKDIVEQEDTATVIKHPYATKFL